jgi:hypothetical protein
MIIDTVSNIHTAIPRLVYGLFHSRRGEIVDRLSFENGVALDIQNPDEILVFWPELKRNPFVDLTTWIFEANQPEPVIDFYIPETHTVAIRRFDLGRDSLSRIAFHCEVLRQKAGRDPENLTMFFGEITLSPEDANRLAFLMDPNGCDWDPYAQGIVEATPIITKPENWDAELQMYQDEGDAAMGYSNRFFRAVANPYLQAARGLSSNEYPAAYSEAAEAMRKAKETDWKFLGEQYLLREYALWTKKNNS